VTIAVGIDAYRHGWVAIVLRDGSFGEGLVAGSLAEVVGRVPEAKVIGVDIPIGLPTSGPRAADVEARRFVGPRRSSVFPTQPRAVWEASDIATARRTSLELTGRSVSAQTYALGPKVLEADELARHDGRIHEVHPEVSFRALAGRPLGASKASWTGMTIRREFLAQAGIDLPDELGEAGMAGVDDVLDAAVVAWTATRIARGQASSLPEDPAVGADGLAAAIWY
jgi:predicted RNase H-like nuclease